MRVARVPALAACLLGLTAPASALPQTFDLTCHLVATISIAGVEIFEKVEDRRMSVDLTLARWCWHGVESCVAVLPIRGVSGDLIKLIDDTVGRVDRRAEVDPISGTFSALGHSRAGDKVETLTTTGRCATAPFTPKIL